jgi:DNA polymerase-3 subunit epsilon
MAVYERQTKWSRSPMTEEEKKKRAEQNAKLKEHGYYWVGNPGNWKLVDTQNGNRETNTAAALDAIESGTRPKVGPVYNYIDRQSAIAFARAIRDSRQIDKDTIFLDTETTGVKDHDVVIQVGVCNLRGDVLMDTLVHPGGVAIHEKAQEAHGIDEMMLEDAPTFAEVWVTLEPLLRDSVLVIYNSAFDTVLLSQTAKQYNLTIPRLTTHCLMRQYAAFHGLVKQGINELVFVPQKLEAACEYFGLPVGGHNALADAEATRQVLLAMANAET